MNRHVYKSGIEYKVKKRGKVLAVSLIFSMMIGLLGGCGNGGQAASSDDQETKGAAADIKTAADGTQADADGMNHENKAMGRYVEIPVDISEYTTLSCGVTQLTDGSLLILDREAGKLVSEDVGETWRVEAIPGISDLAAFTKDNYIFTMKANRDGTVVVLSSPSPEGEETFHTGLLVARPDGSSQTIQELKAGEEGYVSDIWFGPENRLFASILGDSALYEVDMDTGDMHKYLSLPSMPDLVQFQGDYMILLTSQDGITFYNMKEEEWVDDTVLADFMRQNYLADYYCNDTFTVYMVPGEENIIYVAGKGGVYRHVIGGSAMEQIIDGALSSFSNPSMGIVNVITLDNNEFMVLFNGGKLIRYAYDPDVPTVPDELVTVYSLREEDKVRQAIAQYQAQNPQAFVRYEVGLSGSDAVSGEDAVKKLNTELMSGAGPDILILDGLPAESYIDKGVLLDLSDHISKMTGEQELLPNIVESFRQDGKIYRMPISFTIPAMLGRADDNAQVHDLASLADTVERLRKENPGKEIIGMFSEEAAVKWLLPVSAPDFVNASGGLDEQVISDYLEQIKRIYTASLEGISAAAQESYAHRRELYNKGSDLYIESYNNVSSGAMDIIMGDMVFGAGNLKNTYSFQEAVSVNRIEGYEDMRVTPLDGHCSHVFIPDVMVGINASSSHREEAEAFFDVLMSKDLQQLHYDGIVVNQAAMENKLTTDWVILTNSGMKVEYGEVSSSIAASTGDGREFYMEIYMPTREEYQELYDILCELNTPYLAESVVEEAIVEFGAQYLSEYLSLEKAVQKIKSKVDLYMAE